MHFADILFFDMFNRSLYVNECIGNYFLLFDYLSYFLCRMFMTLCTISNMFFHRE